MCEAEFCCDEGQYLADRDQYEREKKAGGDNLLRDCHKRIENQREEIRRLHNHIRNLEQSRNAWEGKAKRLTEENERLREYLDEHFPKCIYQYDGEVQEYCVLSPCGQFKTVAEFQKQIESNTVGKMAELLNAQIDEITRSRIELRAFPFAALLAERMKVIVADTAKKVEEGKV